MRRNKSVVVSQGQARALARSFGWASIGLGVVQLVAARPMSRALGMRGADALVRVCGVREIATGAGLVWSRRPAPWMWARVAGDALDAAVLVTALNGARRHRRTAWLALTAVAGVALVDTVCALALSRSPARRRTAIRDYSTRSGFPRSPAEMRGAARDALVPSDMRAPEPLRPYPIPTTVRPLG